jgi:two-component system, NtrC family, nitrogen regulation sensor histidine kinase NtrY
MDEIVQPDPARSRFLPSRLWERRQVLTSRLAVALAIAATISGFATYGALTQSGPFGPDIETVIILLNVDLVLLLLLGLVVARRLVGLWSERRRGSAGSRLHSRLVAMFSIAAITPAILVGVFSALFFTLGVEAWFSERVKTALDDSLEVAEAYSEEHRGNVRAHVLAMARDLELAGPAILWDQRRLNLFLDTQTALRELSEAVVVRRDGRVLGQTRLSFSLALQPLDSEILNQAGPNEVVIMASDNDDRVRAVTELDSMPDTFLVVGRLVDSRVIGHIDEVVRAVGEFQVLEGRRSDLQVVFALVYVVSALLLLFAAIWFALNFATRLVRPVGALVAAAERVRAGDLTARVPDAGTADELGTLSRAFNRMTGQLSAQRRELIEANRQIDSRRRFTESVLSGVSAGVIGLDADGRIELPNRSAIDLLGIGPDEMIGKSLREVVPEVSGLIDAVMGDHMSRVDGDVEIERQGTARNLTVRITAESTTDQAGEGDETEVERMGYVVTFDDITPLIAAQRKAAWADVARRIAHEIKNPLTPIQLSAERLKRKYLAEITTDPDVFAACTDTIVRQVGDLRHIVNEFSNFARMPAPQFARDDIVKLLNQAITLQEVGGAGVTFVREMPEMPVTVQCDARQIGQVFNNLLQNAIEAIEARRLKDADAPEGCIRVKVAEDGDRCIIAIHDNGRGLPAGSRDKLFEPYVTHRDKGTGLGLAIAQRIVAEHGGSLTLTDSPDGGACARISLMLDRAAGDGALGAAGIRKVSAHGA